VVNFKHVYDDNKKKTSESTGEINFLDAWPAKLLVVSLVSLDHSTP